MFCRTYQAGGVGVIDLEVPANRIESNKLIILPRYLPFLVSIANDILYMVGLDGGLIPGDEDSTRMIATSFLPIFVSI